MSKNKAGIEPLFGRSFKNAAKRQERERKALRYNQRDREADNIFPKEELLQQLHLLKKHKNQEGIRSSRLNFQGYTVQQRKDSAVTNKVIQALKLQKKMASKSPKPNLWLV